MSYLKSILITIAIVACMTNALNALQLTPTEEVVAAFEADRYAVPRNAQEAAIKDRLMWEWKAEALAEALAEAIN